MLKYQRIKDIVVFLYTLKILDGCHCFVSTYSQLPPCGYLDRYYGHLDNTESNETLGNTIHAIRELLHFALLHYASGKFLHFASMLLHFAA